MADSPPISDGLSGSLKPSTEEITTLNGGTVAAEQVQRMMLARRVANGSADDLPSDTTFGLGVDVKRVLWPDDDVIYDGGVAVPIVRDFKTIAHNATQTLIPATASKFGRLLFLLVTTGVVDTTTVTFAGTAFSTQPTLVLRQGFELQQLNAGYAVTSAANVAMTLTAVAATGISTSVWFAYALTATA